MSRHYSSPLLIARNLPLPASATAARVVHLPRYRRRRDPSFQHMIGAWLLMGLLALLALLTTRA